MKNNDKVISDVLSGFQNNKGRACVYCLNPIDYIKIIYEVIVNFKNKHSNDKILIVTKDYEEFSKVKKFFKDKGINHKDLNIDILTKDYINIKYRYDYKLAITIGLDNKDTAIVLHLKYESKFILAVFTKTDFNNNKDITCFLPIINLNVNLENIRRENIYSPVEEQHIKVDLSEEDFNKYKKYTDYINESMLVFGDLSVIEKCKIGDIKNNISAAQFRYNLACKNGWNEYLDTNIEFQKQLDNIYNPNVLYERACIFYNITKERRDLITDNVAKLEYIKNIVEENIDKKIIIVSKRGQFSSIITKYLNENGIKCGDFHDNIESAIAVNEAGETILIKSGKDKGKPKIVGAQAISSYNLRCFNSDNINILSIKSSSDNRLKCDADVIIFTSPYCDSIFDFKKRFNNVSIKTKPHKTYILYCECTIEYDKIKNEPTNSLIKIIEPENSLMYDEKSGDIIL